MCKWLESLSDLKSTGFETACKVLRADEMRERLLLINITPSTYGRYKEMLGKIIASEHDTDGITDTDVPKLSTKGTTLLKQLMTALGNVLEKKSDFNEDFRIAVTRKAGIIRRPAFTVFSSIGKTARCIVLTSGTLSPISSFSSELGVKFPLTLEANHVIPDSQVWVGALTVGTDNKNIKANYQNSETYAFQDEVGKVVLKLCQTVPHGVLCFFPSYSMLEKLKKRWQTTNIWGQILNAKMIYSEPRGSDRSELDSIIEEFYQAANDRTGNILNGALLLAVCRGKVSEGLDFTDDNARAVITIGIPFPDFKDTQVKLKREYNNKHCKARGLLTGNDWYEIQAYRALNQALGRCIRHRKDWGAILLLDERFGGEKYRQGLSRWVRGRCKTYSRFEQCLKSLKTFSDERTANPFPEDSDKACNIAKFSKIPTNPTDNSTWRRDNTNIVKPFVLHEYKDSKEDTRLAESINIGQTLPSSATCIKPDTFDTPVSKKKAASFQESIMEEDQTDVNLTAADENHCVDKSNVDLRYTNANRGLKSNLISTEPIFMSRRGAANIIGSVSDIGSIHCNRSKLFKSVQPIPKNAHSKTNAAENKKISEKEERIKECDIIELDSDNDADNVDSGGGDDYDDDDDDDNNDDDDDNNDDGDDDDDDDDDNAISKGRCINDTDPVRGKEETPLLFSDSGAEIGSFEDRFWDYADDEMSEFQLENISSNAEQESSSRVASKIGHKALTIEKRGIERNYYVKKDEQNEEAKQEYFGLKNATVVEGNTVVSCSKEAKKIIKFTKREQDMEEDKKEDTDGDKRNRKAVKTDRSSLIIDQPNIEQKRSTLKTKSNIRMTGKTDHSDLIDFGLIDSDSSDSSNLSHQVNIRCLQCNARFLKRGKFACRKVTSTILSNLTESVGNEVDVIETTLSALRNCEKIEKKCECEANICDMQLNAIFAEKERAVYIPLFCSKCHSKRKETTLVGLQTIHIGDSNFDPKANADGDCRVLLLPDQILMDVKSNESQK